MIDRHGPYAPSPKRETLDTSLNGRVATFRTTKEWEGPYELLRPLRDAIAFSATSTSLVPEAAGQARLTAVYELTAAKEPTEEDPLPPPVYEVIWTEVRLPVEENPYFAALTAEDAAAVEAALKLTAAPPVGGLAADLYTLKALGTTEWPVGAPVIRATEAGLPDRPELVETWVRNNPPTAAEGPAGWEWLITACEIRNEGGIYTRVREWTGAKPWHPILYPPA